MEIKRVAPETTDVITHVNDRKKSVSRQRMQSRKEYSRSDDRNEDLVFGVLPKSTVGMIALVLLFAMALIFGIKELEMSIPVYLIVLIFCTIMGVLLAGAPGFVSVMVGALLLIVGGITSFGTDTGLFPAVSLGVAMLIAASLIIRGE